MTQITMCISGEVVEGHFLELSDGDGHEKSGERR
jgi:hypothetical protein